jgi:sugar/nucleoside kinase (ribokinase family)
VDHLEKPENWAAVEAAKVVYSAGFFITVSPEAIAKTSRHCCDKGKVYCMVRSWGGGRWATCVVLVLGRMAWHVRQFGASVARLAEGACAVEPAGWLLSLAAMQRGLMCAGTRALTPALLPAPLQNLSAPFIMQVPPFKAVLLDTMPYIDILFGNEHEAAAFAESENLGTSDLSEIALKVGVDSGSSTAAALPVW